MRQIIAETVDSLPDEQIARYSEDETASAGAREKLVKEMVRYAAEAPAGMAPLERAAFAQSKIRQASLRIDSDKRVRDEAVDFVMQQKGISRMDAVELIERNLLPTTPEAP